MSEIELKTKAEVFGYLFNEVYRDLAGSYIKGTFNYIEENYHDLWQQIQEKEDEIENNWNDKISEQQFKYMLKEYKKLMLKAIFLARAGK